MNRPHKLPNTITQEHPRLNHHDNHKRRPCQNANPSNFSHQLQQPNPTRPRKTLPSLLNPNLPLPTQNLRRRPSLKTAIKLHNRLVLLRQHARRDANHRHQCGDGACDEQEEEDEVREEGLGAGDVEVAGAGLVVWVGAEAFQGAECAGEEEREGEGELGADGEEEDGGGDA
jgi:hypothetical protein